MRRDSHSHRLKAQQRSSCFMALTCRLARALRLLRLIRLLRAARQHSLPSISMGRTTRRRQSCHLAAKIYKASSAANFLVDYIRSPSLLIAAWLRDPSLHFLVVNSWAAASILRLPKSLGSSATVHVTGFE